LALRHNKTTNISGHRVEFASLLINPRTLFKGRESRIQKAQIEKEHAHGTRKDVKTPIKYRIH